jgi:hypothetical protein
MPQGPIGRRSRTFCDTNAVTFRFSIFLLGPAKGTMQNDVLDRVFPTKTRSLGTLSCISIITRVRRSASFRGPDFATGPVPAIAGKQEPGNSIVHPRCRKAAEGAALFLPHKRSHVPFFNFLLGPAKGTMQNDVLDRVFPTKTRSLGVVLV